MESDSQNVNKKACAILSAGHVTVDTYGGFLTPLLPFIADKLSVSVAIISLLISISHLTSSIMQPFFGYISDTLTRRFFVFWGLIFASVFMSLTGVMPNAWLLGVAILLGNLGVGFYHPQATSLISFFAGNKINLIMGLFTACGTVGYALGPLISSRIVDNYGLERLPFAMGFGIVFALVLYKVLPKIPKNLNHKPRAKFFDAIKIILKDRLLSILTVISIMKALITLSYCIWMPFVWKELGYSVEVNGNALSAFAFLGGIASPVGGRVADMLGRRKVFYISLIPIFPLTYLFIHFLEINPTLSFILFGLVGFFTMFSVSVNIITAQQAMSEYKGMISGVIGGFSWGLMGLMLTPLGFLANKFGITNIILLISIIPLLSTFLIRYIPESQND